MIVIGIGGSNLGTQAVYEAIYGKAAPDFRLYFAESVDTDYIAFLLHKVQMQLQQKKPVLITVISKSGSTTETIANFECFLAEAKKHAPDTYADYITVITDKNSALWQLAGKEDFDLLEIPKNVGGRYSVLSPVGLFPLACAGIDIVSLRKGAADMLAFCLDTNLVQNPAAQSALILAHYYQKGFNIHDTFIFDGALESLGKWYRQLMGESIGKTSKKQNKKVGITPTVSIGSTDLHSVGQLYLGGPHDKITTFVWIEKPQEIVMVPILPAYETLVAHIQGNTLHDILTAIFSGVQKAYGQQDLPFMTIRLLQKDSYCIGQLLQMKMVEMIYLGALLEVNPFDQPEVELYKIQTRKILAHE